MKNTWKHYNKLPKMKSIDQLSQKINALLPQTQCEQCGYKGCKPYAEAIAKGEANIDLCAPGGEATLQALAELLHIDANDYVDKVRQNYRPPSIAVIDEDLCIGCVKCINACPVDAIVGSAKLMHTVIADECTGCELCVPACPMDCITLHSVQRNDADYQQQWKQRYEQRQQRLLQQQQQKKQQHNSAKSKQEILAALARVKARDKS